MKLSYFLIMGVVLLGCKKGTNSNNGSNGLAASTQLDLAYGNDPAQKMDVYLPAGRTTASTPTIILIHGGAWSSGDKTDFTPFVDTLRRRLPGYAIININYRLSTGITNFFPTQENDVKAAIDFIVSKQDQLQVSNKLVLLGASAGGHLALLQAYKYPTAGNIKAVVDFFGPVDLTDMFNHPASVAIPAAALALIIGATPTSNPGIYLNSSPLTFVSATSAPTIILQGGLDPLVSPSQSVSLDAKLQTVGVAHQYVFYPTEMHGWIGANLSDSFDKITAFITAHIN